MPYMPSAASLAAAHKGKIKNIWSAALKDLENCPGVVILEFESEAKAYDMEQTRKVGQTGN